MRAARLSDRLSDHLPDRLRVEESGRPVTGQDEVLVQVHAVGVNQLELAVMNGARLGPPALLPRTVGIDPAGVVVAQGGAVVGDRVGERVAVKPNVPCGECGFCADGAEADCRRQQVVGVHRDGGAADYVAVPARVAIPIPGQVPFTVAAAAVHSVPIALHMIRRAGGVRPGDTVLVTGATGALGCAALQVAAALGGKVLAGALNDEPVDDLPGLGATAVLTYGRDDAGGLAEQVRGHAPDGVAIAIDATGSGPLISAGVRSLAWAGQAVFAAALPGARLDLDPRELYTRRLTLHGSAAADYADVRDGLALVADGTVKPPVAAEFPLPEVADAYAMAGRRDHVGKVVLHVR